MTAFRCVIFAAWLAACLGAQTTEGLITGRVFDQKDGSALPGATLECKNQLTEETTTATSGPGGYYTLLRLSPGMYWIRAVKPGYQAREAYELELFVAGRMALDIPMRVLSDTYSQDIYAGAYLPPSGASAEAIVHVYATDLESTRTQPLSILLGRSGSLLSTLSYVVDPRQVRDLPLAGRDIYTMLVALPGVTADNATARGLGLSVNGQRSSASNFLLDGVENNDYLLTGPLTVIAPEAIQEYRVSTANFSAEFGRTSGFVANAVTRAGTNDFHGVIYGYLGNTALDANSYQHIAGLNTTTGDRGAKTLPRQPRTDAHEGFWTGGPLMKNRLFGSAAFERFQSRSETDPIPFDVPVLTCFEQNYPGKASTSLLQRFRPPTVSSAAAASCNSLSTTFDAPQPLQFNRNLALGRLDRVYHEGAQKLLARVAISRFGQPDFIYSIYPGFSSSLDVNSTSVAAAHLWRLGAATNNEARFAFRNSSQGWDRPHPEVAQLIADTVSLPGSDASYGFAYRVNSGEWNDTLTLSRGRHVLALGGGVLFNRSYSNLTFRRDGLYTFASLAAFGQDAPIALQVAVARSGPQGLPVVQRTPDYARTYSNNQFYGFIQDSIKLTRSVGINAGVRYESFGAPKSTGVQDGYFQLGSGASIQERLAGASLVYDDSRQRSVYQPDRNNWAGRLGAYYDLLGRGRTVFRASYGMFYDRPFDSLTLSTRNNDFEQVTLRPAPSYPQVTRQAPPGVGVIANSIPTLLWVDENLRTPLVQSWFGGLQHQFNSDFYFEATAQGSAGRKLISTDSVNRRAVNSLTSQGRLNPNIPEDIFFRSNAASSNYTALTALSRYRSRRGEFQIAYTWGHSIDTQSDPLQGTFDDLQFSRAGNTPTGNNRAGFTRQFETGADRANSDFDQRHSLVVQSVWEVGRKAPNRAANLLLDHWQVAGIAGFRSGFPFSLVTTSDLPTCTDAGAPASPTTLLRNRPSLIPGRSAFLANRVPVPGGYQILDPSAFCNPSAGVVGNLGRNSLTGPGFWNIDLSLAKSFRPKFLGEAGALQFRADFFNALNHANLANPDTVAEIGGRSTFGQALFGRQGVQPSFPSAAPLDQLARQIQVQLKILF